MGKKLTRRDFVKLGSGSLLLPLLPSIYPIQARAAGAKPPLRIVFLVSWNGVQEQCYWPTPAPANLVGENIKTRKLTEYAGPLSGILNSDLDSLRNNFSIVRGLAYQIPHQPLHWGAHVLTHQIPWQPDKDNDMSPQRGSSVDAVMQRSAALKGKTKFGAIRIYAHNAINPGNISGRPICFFNPTGGANSLFGGQQLMNPSIAREHSVNITQMFNTYLGGLADSQTPTTVTKVASPNRSAAFDFALSQFSALSNSTSLSSFDRQRTTEHIDMLNDLKKRVLAADTSTETIITGCQPGSPVSYQGNMKTRVENALAIIAGAFACDVTRIGVVSLDAYADNDTDSGTPGTYHANSHKLLSGVDSPALCTQWMGWQASRVASFMKRLDSMTDTDGSTVLDNTIVVWLNGMGTDYILQTNGTRSGPHSLWDIPVMIGGGGGGLFRMGEYVDYRKNPPKTDGLAINTLFNSLLRSMGVTEAEYAIHGVDGGFGSRHPNQSVANHRANIPYIYTGS